MKKIKVTALFIGIIVLFAAITVQATTTVPSWRGDEGSTYQKWTFDNNLNPAETTADSNNPYGDPTLTVVGMFPETIWMNNDNGHQGVWNFSKWIEIFVPNNDQNTLPQSNKIIRIRMVYDAGRSCDQIFNPTVIVVPSTSTAAGTPTTNDQPIILDNPEVEILDNKYVRGIWNVTIWPNPISEKFYIKPRYCQLYVDEIEIDTICTPEPVTITFVLLGSLGIIAKRKRQKL